MILIGVDMLEYSTQARSCIKICLQDMNSVEKVFTRYILLKEEINYELIFVAVSLTLETLELLCSLFICQPAWPLADNPGQAGRPLLRRKEIVKGEGSRRTDAEFLVRLTGETLL